MRSAHIWMVLIVWFTPHNHVEDDNHKHPAQGWYKTKSQCERSWLHPATFMGNSYTSPKDQRGLFPLKCSVFILVNAAGLLCQILMNAFWVIWVFNTNETYPDSHSRHTVGASVGSLVRAAACFDKTDTTPPCSSERDPRPGNDNRVLRSGSTQSSADETCLKNNLQK